MIGGDFLIYRPLYMNKILPFFDTPFVKIITGIRRCGKSTILKMIQGKLLERNIKPEQILFYRFDSLELENLKNAADMYNEIKSNLHPSDKTYLLLDEVQEVQNWEKVVNSLMTDFNVDIFVTGSNSRMLSAEISTYLTGRYVSFKIFPLTFSEYMNFRQAYSKPDNIKAEFARFIRFGGFPAVHTHDFNLDEVYTIARDIYNSTIFTDIVKRNQIRKIDQLERIVKYLFDNIGQTFSATSISKYIRSQNRTLDTETIYNYLDNLEKAFIIYRCQRYDIKGKAFLKSQEKFYIADLALKHSVLGYNPNDIATAIENIIYIELSARGYTVSVGKLDDFEIDFIAEKSNDKIYIQVTYSINSPETEKREYDNLLKIKDNYPKFVLRMDDFAESNYKGIKTLHISDFLLSDYF
jgi:hypothetical protein